MILENSFFISSLNFRQRSKTPSQVLGGVHKDFIRSFGTGVSLGSPAKKAFRRTERVVFWAEERAFLLEKRWVGVGMNFNPNPRISFAAGGIVLLCVRS